MKKREIDTAARFGLLDRLQALENDLTAIPGTTYINTIISSVSAIAAIVAAVVAIVK